MCTLAMPHRSERASTRRNPSASSAGTAGVAGNVGHPGQPSGTFDYTYASFWDDVESTPLHDIGHILRRREIARCTPQSVRRVLSVGSGFGEELLDLKRRAHPPEFVCLDLSDLALARCRKILGASIVHGDVTHMSFRDAEFDFLAALEILEHVPDDRKGAAELFRVLAPGGLLVASMPHWKLTREWIETGHLRHYSHEDFVRLFTDAGFEFVDDLNNYQRTRFVYKPFKWMSFRWNQLLNLLLREKREYVDRWLYRRCVSPLFLRIARLEDGSKPHPKRWGGLWNFALFRKPELDRTPHPG